MGFKSFLAGTVLVMLSNAVVGTANAALAPSCAGLFLTVPGEAGSAKNPLEIVGRLSFDHFKKPVEILKAEKDEAGTVWLTYKSGFTGETRAFQYGQDDITSLKKQAGVRDIRGLVGRFFRVKKSEDQIAVAFNGGGKASWRSWQHGRFLSLTKNAGAVRFLGFDGRSYSVRTASPIVGIILRNTDLFKGMDRRVEIGNLNRSIRGEDDYIADVKIRGPYKYAYDKLLAFVGSETILPTGRIEKLSTYEGSLGVKMTSGPESSVVYEFYPRRFADSLIFLSALKAKLPITVSDGSNGGAVTIDAGTGSRYTFPKRYPTKDGAYHFSEATKFLSFYHRGSAEFTTVSWIDDATQKSFSLDLADADFEKMMTSVLLGRSVSFQIVDGELKK